MENLGEVYYQIACAFFENMQYEEAVENFIKAYELDFCRKEILEALYSCFVVPNEDEFHKNYEENSVGIQTAPYEDLCIDFIPVSDKKFFLFDKERQEFDGYIELEETDDPKEGFHSFLIADYWDIRKLWPSMKERDWAVVYIVLNQQKEKFFSFFKLPEFREKYLKKVVVLETTEYMKQVFQEYSDFYLPKEVLAPNSQYYADLIEELHRERLADKKIERKNVFLSICIPSYNRGDRALRAVQEICKSVYDSEIEVIVSNNASEINTDGYEEIKNMRDSRVVYRENENNVGIENFLRVLEVAKGKYAVLCSDEDIMILQNLPYHLNMISKHKQCSVIQLEGVGANFGCLNEQKNYTVNIGMGAVIAAINKNYITGACYNMELLRKINGIEIARERMDNDFVRTYVHCFLNLELILVCDSLLEIENPPLWYAEEAVEGEYDEAQPRHYMMIDNREKQHIGAINALIELGIRGESLMWLYVERSEKFLWLLNISMQHYEEYYKKQGITKKQLLYEAKKRCVEGTSLCNDYLSVEEMECLKQQVEKSCEKICTGKFRVK